MSPIRERARRFVGRVLRVAVGVVIATLSVEVFVAIGWLRPIEVAGDSMAPALPARQRLLVRRWLTPRRWDAVVLRSPTDARRLVVKRVVGLPGERVRLAEGEVWADGVMAPRRNDSPAESVYYGAWGLPEWRLGADEWFVAGDNQAVSVDSRNWDHAAGLPGRLLVGVVIE